MSYPILPSRLLLPSLRGSPSDASHDREAEQAQADGERRRRRWLVAGLLASALLVGLDIPPVRAQAAEDSDAPVMPGAPALSLRRPAWYTDAVHEKVLAAGRRGVEIALPNEDATVPRDCLGHAPPLASPAPQPAVTAGGCMVHPRACSMNYVFTDGRAQYIGTAGHCVDGGGDAVVMQVGGRIDAAGTTHVTVARIGRVARRADSGIGRDFALVRIDPGWRVVPRLAATLGPTGVFCGDPVGQPVRHHGHGRAPSAQHGRAAEVIPDFTIAFGFRSEDGGYNWTGHGLPGDSGSPVTGAAGLAVGHLTHGVGATGLPLPGLSFGTTMGGIFAVIGPAFSLVTLDHRAVRCRTASV